MLDIVTNIVTTLGQAIYYALVISYTIGQLIVTTTKVFITMGGELLIASQTVCRVIIEDFTYFARDVFAALQTCSSFISAVITNVWNSIANFVGNCYAIAESIYSIVAGFCMATFAIVRNLLTSIQELLFMIKRMVILFGSGVWFAVTLIPVSIMYFCTTVTYYMGRLIDECYEMSTSILRKVLTLCYEVYSFVTDVPVESMAGICAVICIVYLMTRFHMMAFRLLYLLVASLYTNVSGVVGLGSHRVRCITGETTRWVMRILRIRSRDRDEEPSHVSTPSHAIADTQFCVICQEHLKCVLTLPCRHVCLCGACFTEMRHSNMRTCPLCRKYIEKHMKVYI